MNSKKKVRIIKKALKQPELYSEEEYKHLMSGFFDALVQDEMRKQSIKRKGFGYVESETGISDSESRGDDGVRCEGEQPEQPGQSESSGST